MNSETLKNEIDALAERMSALRAEMVEAEESSVTLEQKLNEAQGRHALASRALADHEALIAAKEQEMRAAEGEEAVRRRDEAAERLAGAIDQLLLAIEAHDAALNDVSAKHGGLEPNPENDPLGDRWDSLKDAVRDKSEIRFGDERVDAAIRSGLPDAIGSLPADLREVARARMRARHRARQGRGPLGGMP